MPKISIIIEYQMEDHFKGSKLLIKAYTKLNKLTLLEICTTRWALRSKSSFSK